MAKWDFKIVGASFVKELVPVDGDVQFRSQSFMQPSFDLQGDKIVMKESGAYKSAILFPQIGEIDGVAPTNLEDAYAKLLTLVENFNGGGGTPVTTPKMFTALISQTGEFDKQSLSSGAVTKGVTYKIDGDSDGDFSNVGAPNNDDLTSFVAINDEVPNSYGSAELTYDLGAPTVIVLENTIGNIWFEYSAEGLYLCKSSKLFTLDKTIIDMDAYCQNGNPASQLIYKDLTDDVFTIGTYKDNFTNDYLTNNRLEIKVYN